MKTLSGHFFRLGVGPIAVSLATWLAGCAAVGPKYEAPEVGAPDQWTSQSAVQTTSDTLAVESLTNWWSTFDDPILTSLIDESFENNLDLQTVLSRVRQSRAQSSIAESEYYPTVDSSASAAMSYSRTEMNDPTGVGTTTLESDSQPIRAGFDVSWELDVFGGVRRSVEASQGDYEAQIASYYDALVTLSAEVASNYVAARTYQARIAIAEENLAVQKESMDLVEAKFQADVIDELPLLQARYNYKSSEAQIPSLRAGLAESLNRLAILNGQNPGAVSERMLESRDIPTPIALIDLGLPSEALRRRPDIRQAERELAAQTARVGVAVAELYPKFTLSAAFSRQGDGSLGFRELATDIWSFGPNVSWRVFQGGAIEKNITVQEEQAEQAYLGYQTTILNALEEVENKLSSVGEERIRRDFLTEAVEAAEEALVIARAQYDAGRVDFSEVISAQQALLNFRDNLAQSDSQIVTNVISLYKAVGGGWSPETPIELSSLIERNWENEQEK